MNLGEALKKVMVDNSIPEPDQLSVFLPAEHTLWQSGRFY